MCLWLLLSVADGTPAHWDPIDAASGSSVLVLLSKDDPKHTAELQQVHASWNSTGGMGTLVSVYRVQNLSQHLRYESFKQANLHTHKEISVYHGCGRSGAVPATILEGSTGFDPKFGMALPGYLWFAEHG